MPEPTDPSSYLVAMILTWRGEIKQGLSMCIFCNTRLHYLFSLRGSPSGGSSPRVLRAISLTCMSRQSAFSFVSRTVFSCLQFLEEKQRVLHKLTCFLHRLVNAFEHTWCSFLCSLIVRERVDSSGVKVESLQTSRHQQNLRLFSACKLVSPFSVTRFHQ